MIAAAPPKSNPQQPPQGNSILQAISKALKQAIESVAGPIERVLNFNVDEKDNIIGKFNDGDELYDFVISPAGDIEYGENEVRTDAVSGNVCTKGRKCGDSCVNKGDKCRTKLSPAVTQKLNGVRGAIKQAKQRTEPTSVEAQTANQTEAKPPAKSGRSKAAKKAETPKATESKSGQSSGVSSVVAAGIASVGAAIALTAMGAVLTSKQKTGLTQADLDQARAEMEETFQQLESQGVDPKEIESFRAQVEEALKQYEAEIKPSTKQSKTDAADKLNKLDQLVDLIHMDASDEFVTGFWFEGRIDKAVEPKSNKPTKAGHVWVEDERVKKGGYFRKLPQGSKAEARISPESATTHTIKGAAAGTIAGAIAGAGAMALAQNLQKKTPDLPAPVLLPAAIEISPDVLPPLPPDEPVVEGGTSKRNFSINAKHVIVAGAALAAMPPATYLVARTRYRMGFQESARQSREIAEKVKQDLPKELKGGYKGINGKEAKQITFVVGGFAGQGGENSLQYAQQFAPNSNSQMNETLKKQAEETGEEPDLFDDHHVVAINNRDFEIRPAGQRSKFQSRVPLVGQEITDGNTEQFRVMLKSGLIEGRNPVAVDTAAQAYAYHQQFPDKPINLLGYSAGGMVTHEAAHILKELNVPNVRVANFGSPYWGLTDKVGDSITFASKNDPAISQGGVAVRDPIMVNGVVDHFSYLRDADVRRKLKNLFDGNPPQSETSVWIPGISPEPKEAPRDVKQSKAAEEEAEKRARRIEEVQRKREERRNRKDSIAHFDKAGEGKECGKGWIAPDKECQIKPGQAAKVSPNPPAIGAGVGAVVAAGLVGAGALALANRRTPEPTPAIAAPVPAPKPVPEATPTPNPAPAPEQKRFGLSPTAQKAVLTAAVVVGVPTATYLAGRARYRAGFKESADLATQKAGEIEVGSIKQRQHTIIFGAGGMAYEDESPQVISGERITTAARLAFSEDKGKDFKVVPVSNAAMNVPTGRKRGNKIDQTADVLGIHYRTFVEQGRNPAAIEMAAHVIAYGDKYGDRQLVMMGHSMGGMVVHEAEEIIRVARPEYKDRLKSFSFGTPWGGLTESFGESHTINSSNDSTVSALPARDLQNIDSVQGHTQESYFRNPDVQKFVKDAIYRDIRKGDSQKRSDAFIEGCNSVRRDEKMRPGHTWVDDDRVEKGGGYWRKLKGGKKPEAAPRASKASPRIEPQFAQRLQAIGVWGERLKQHKVSPKAAAKAAAKAVFTIPRDLKQSQATFESIRQPPNGIPDAETLAYYDTLKPGDLIRKNFKAKGWGVRQHYGVYVGKDTKTGDHLMIDTDFDRNNPGSPPAVRMSKLTDRVNANNTQYERVPTQEMYQHPGSQPMNREEIVGRAKSMLGQTFTYRGFESNCESFARGIVEGVPYSSQGAQITEFTKTVSSIVTDAALQVDLKTGKRSRYGNDRFRMSAQQIVEFLDREAQQDQSIGHQQQKLIVAKRNQRYQSQFNQDAAEDDNLLALALSPNGITAGDWFAQNGLRSPQEFAEVVEAIAAPLPGLAPAIRVELYQAYLLVLMTFLAQPSSQRTDAFWDGYNSARLDKSTKSCGAGESWVEDDRVEGGGYCRRVRKGKRNPQQGSRTTPQQNSSVAARPVGAMTTGGIVTALAGAVALGAAGAVAYGAAKRQAETQQKQFFQQVAVQKKEFIQEGEQVAQRVVKQGVNKAIATGAIAAGIGAVGGSAATYWMSQEGVKRQVQEARKQSDRRVEQETAKVRQESEAKLTEAVSTAQTETEARLEQTYAQEKSRVEAEYQKQRSTLEQEVGRRSQQVTDLETQVQERTTALQRIKNAAKTRVKKLTDKLRQMRSQQQQAIAEGIEEGVKPAVAELETRKQQLDRDYEERVSNLVREHGDRLQQLQVESDAEVNRRTAEISEQLNNEKLREVEAERVKITQEAWSAYDQRLAGKTNKTSLVNDDKEGIALQVSLRRMKSAKEPIEISDIEPADMEKRFDRAVTSLVERRQQQAMKELATAFSDRMREVRGKNLDADGKWQMTEHALIRQSNREAGVSNELDEVRKRYQEQHRKALRDYYQQVEGRGSHDDDLIKRLDKKLTDLNKAMQSEIDRVVQEVVKAQPLDQPMTGQKRSN